MAYWLMKSEPDAFSWDNLVSRGPKGEGWDGVRNYQARNNMRAMKVGDMGFFYHSNEGLEVVGILEVIALAHPDRTDDTGKWECVDVKAVAPMPKPVTLDAIRANPKLAKMVLVNNSRLSVQPVSDDEWAEVCRMGGLASGKTGGLASGKTGGLASGKTGGLASGKTGGLASGKTGGLASGKMAGLDAKKSVRKAGK